MTGTNIRTKQDTQVQKRIHWNERARQYGRSYGGYKAICSYGAPYFYNKYIDLIQKKAFYRMFRSQSADRKKILDVGCGVGRWCLILRQLGAEVTGTDISVEMINVARLSTPETNITFLNSSIAQLDLPSHSFDYITSVTVLQHITDENEFVRSVVNMVRLLKPGGRIHLLEVAPDRLPFSMVFNDFMHVRTQHEYEQTFQQAGAKLVASYAVDIFPLKQYLISCSARLPKPWYYLLLHFCTVAALLTDWCFSGTRFLRSYSWHKALVLMKTERNV